MLALMKEGGLSDSFMKLRPRMNKQLICPFLAYFPKKESEAYEITSLSVSLSVCLSVCVSP
jgi:hypothetical protein